jgi:two-component system chemotaxis response regulator CheB
MPRHAIASVDPTYVLPVEELAEKLADLAVAPTVSALPRRQEFEMSEHDQPRHGEDPQPGRRSAFACPECGGALWEVDSGDFVHYRCRVGHAFSDNSLLALQGDQLETALWTALRALEERAALNRRVASRSARAGRQSVATRYRRQARDADENAAVVRDLLETFEAAAVPDPASEPDTAAG